MASERRRFGALALVLAIALGAAGGCAEDAAAPEPETELEPAIEQPSAEPAETSSAASDAGTPARPDEGAAAAPTIATDEELPKPAGGFHLDSDAIEYRPRPVRRPKRERRPIELLLRSTPSGATAAIDGTVVGTTPTYWAGEADGKAHEFTFVKPGYAMARYRFVPTVGGIVHGSLEPLARGPEGDAGAAH